MISSGLYGVMVTILCQSTSVKFRQMFADFKVEIPDVTQALLRVSDWVWTDHLWMVLLPLSIVWPLLVMVVPAPQTLESRRVIVRLTRYLVVLIFGATVAITFLGLFMPMIALIQSVSGPQKN